MSELSYFKQAAEDYLKNGNNTSEKKRKLQVRNILLANNENIQ